MRVTLLADLTTSLPGSRNAAAADKSSFIQRQMGRFTSSPPVHACEAFYQSSSPINRLFNDPRPAA